jgi:hypothetical protein
VSFLKVKNYLDDNKKMQRRKRSCKDGTRRGILAILKSARGKGKQMNTGYNENYITDIIKRKSRKNGRNSRKQSRKKVVKRSQRRFSRFDDDEEEDEEDELEKAIMKAAAASTSTAASTLDILERDARIFGGTDATLIFDAIKKEYQKRDLTGIEVIGNFNLQKAKTFLLDFDKSRKNGYLEPMYFDETTIDALSEDDVNTQLNRRNITVKGTEAKKRQQLKDFEKIRKKGADKFGIISLPSP